MQLTALPDFQPVPRVNIRIEPGDILPGTLSVTVLATHEGRERPVRGLVDIPWSGADVARLDVTPPFGVAVTYRAQMIDADGRTIGYTPSQALEMFEITDGGSSAATAANVIDGGSPSDLLELADGGPAAGLGVGITPLWDVQDAPALIQCPFDPKLAVQVTLLTGSAGTVSRKVSGSVSYTQTGDRPVWVGTGELSGKDAPLVIFTDAAGADMLQRITEAYPVWLIRTGQQMRIPRQWHAVSTDLVEADFDHAYGGDRVAFSSQLIEVEPPALGLIEPLLTYDDLDAAYPTYTARDAAYASYSDTDADWSLAGAAGS